MFEMHELSKRLAAQAVSVGGLVKALQHLLEERYRMHNLKVTLEVNRNGSLDPAEEAGLFRIAQEALNNVVKHVGVNEAIVRRHLSEPAPLKVEDRGASFDPQQIPDGWMGLAGRRELAAEIGG